MVMHLPRLTEPLVRENGSLRPASWDEALDRAAEGFRRVMAQHGGDAIGMFSCSKATQRDELPGAEAGPRSVFGSNNIDSCNRT